MIACTKCNTALPVELARQADFGVCPACGVAVLLDVFPALFKVGTPVSATTVRLLDEASCFYHANKPADTLCNRCGRFLCPLCAFTLDGQTWCAGCLAEASQKNSIRSLDTRRTLWDSIALGVAVAPVFLYIFWIVTAPMTLYFTIRYWTAPGSIVPRSKVRFVIAASIALLELLIVGVAIYFLLANFHNLRGGGRL